MALKAASRVRETTTTTGTGTVTLLGASTGFQSFGSGIGVGNTCYYCITDGTAWEVGLGTVGSGTLARTTVLASSNGGALVNFSAGTKTVINGLPGEVSVASFTQMTEATLSGTSVDFTSIPSGVKFLMISVHQATIGTTTNRVIRLGYSGGIIATGYTAVCLTDASVNHSSSTGFVFSSTSFTNPSNGCLIATRVDSAGTKWTASGIISETNSIAHLIAGGVTLTGELDRVRFTTINGTAVYNSGNANISFGI